MIAALLAFSTRASGMRTCMPFVKIGPRRVPWSVTPYRIPCHPKGVEAPAISSTQLYRPLVKGIQYVVGFSSPVAKAISSNPQFVTRLKKL